ncbi:hypothetical protein MMC06_001857 [Schaereria dolodes]|nr:hypothetical protein [Schaereria dolodes]
MLALDDDDIVKIVVNERAHGTWHVALVASNRESLNGLTRSARPHVAAPSAQSGPITTISSSTSTLSSLQLDGEMHPPSIPEVQNQDIRTVRYDTKDGVV